MKPSGDNPLKGLRVPSIEEIVDETLQDLGLVAIDLGDPKQRAPGCATRSAGDSGFGSNGGSLPPSRKPRKGRCATFSRWPRTRTISSDAGGS